MRFATSNYIMCLVSSVLLGLPTVLMVAFCPGGNGYLFKQLLCIVVSQSLCFVWLWKKDCKLKKCMGKRHPRLFTCGLPQYLVVQESLDLHELEEERNWVTYAWLIILAIFLNEETVFFWYYYYYYYYCIMKERYISAHTCIKLPFCCILDVILLTMYIIPFCCWLTDLN